MVSKTVLKNCTFYHIGCRHWVCILPIVQTIIPVPNYGGSPGWTIGPLERWKAHFSIKIVRFSVSLFQTVFRKEENIHVFTGGLFRSYKDKTVKIRLRKDSHRERQGDAYLKRIRQTSISKIRRFRITHNKPRRLW